MQSPSPTVFYFLFLLVFSESITLADVWWHLLVVGKEARTFVIVVVIFALIVTPMREIIVETLLGW